jgi:N-carbamoylputrescine amidase
MKDIRIAAVTFNSAVNQVNPNLDRMIPWIEKARTNGADLICFPELNVTGYSTKPENNVCAEPIPGPITKRLVQMADENQIVILAGMAEMDEKGRVFASHLVVTPQTISGIYRKIHIAPPEHDIFSRQFSPFIRGSSG